MEKTREELTAELHEWQQRYMLLKEKYDNDIREHQQTELLLRQSESRYKRLHETMLDCYVQTDMTGAIVDFNKSYIDMLGYLPEEMGRLTYMDLTPEKWHEFETGLIDTQILVRGYSDIYEKEYIKKDGTVFSVELRTILL